MEQTDVLIDDVCGFNPTALICVDITDAPQTLADICRNMGICSRFRAVADGEKYPCFILINTISLFSGIGYTAVYMSGIVAVQQYFVQRRALAHGIYTTGLSVGFFTLPTVVRVIISQYAWQGALVLISGILLHGLIFAALLKPVRHKRVNRETINVENNGGKDTDVKLRNDRAHYKIELFKHHEHVTFILFLVGVFGVHIGHLAILTYLPLRCDMTHLTKTEASNLMTIIGVMGIFIRPVMGHLADQPWMNRVVMFGIASVLTGILTGVSTQVYSFSGLAVASALFGFLSGRLEMLC